MLIVLNMHLPETEVSAGCFQEKPSPAQAGKRFFLIPFRSSNFSNELARRAGGLSNKILTWVNSSSIHCSTAQLQAFWETLDFSAKDGIICKSYP